MEPAGVNCWMAYFVAWSIANTARATSKSQPHSTRPIYASRIGTPVRGVSAPLDFFERRQAALAQSGVIAARANQRRVIPAALALRAVGPLDRHPSTCVLRTLGPRVRDHLHLRHDEKGRE